VTGSADDHDLFAEAMGKVRPLQLKTKVLPAKRPPRGYEVSDLQQHTSSLPHHTDQPADLITNPDGLLLASGISRERLKRLRAGQPPIDHTLDLHGITRDAALTLLEECFSDALQQQNRVLCIVHGRGLHSSDGKPVLKQAVHHWLRHGPVAAYILAVIPQPGSGGGACLVLLRRQGN